MGWYGAHIIVYLKFLDNFQQSYSVNENIVLLKANNTQEAWSKAKELGAKYEVDITVGPENREARWIFAGIRALVQCQDIDTNTLKQPSNFEPKSGTEVTYISMTVSNEEMLRALVDGKSLTVSLDDTTPFGEEELRNILNEVVRKIE